MLLAIKETPPGVEAMAMEQVTVSITQKAHRGLAVVVLIVMWHFSSPQKFVKECYHCHIFGHFCRNC